MSNIIVVPKRSMGGCLTCKRRKKKCDEQRPHCRRCIQGGFQCLGYSSPEDRKSPGQIVSLNRSSNSPVTQDWSGCSDSTSLDGLILLPEYANGAGKSLQLRSPIHQITTSPSTIPSGLTLDPLALESATSLIMSQYLRLTQELLFKPPSSSLEKGLLWRIEYSDFTRWSMYLGARLIKDISNGINGQKYAGWIFRFCQRILESSTSTEPEEAMDGRLAGIHDLAHLGFIASGIAFGYSLFQRCTPTFLQLVAIYPELWSDSHTIFISKTLRSRYEIIKFVAHDTVIAFLLGIPPLLHYDTTLPWGEEKSGWYLELVYGIPAEILYIFAKVNSWRTSRMMGNSSQNHNDWRDIEGLLGSWNSVLDHTDEPIKDIARLAVQEAWRQAALIYFYMGTRDVNSADPRVEAAVRQIVQLGSTVDSGNAPEIHLMVPCVIAGAAARQERHRAKLRNKIVSGSSQREIIMVLRASELIPVLDHLWHGEGAEGKPTTWEDYVQSRCTILPITC